MPETAEKAVATLMIHGAAEMTPEGRREIAVWLREQVKSLLHDGDNYAPRFRARYFVQHEAVATAK